MNRAKQATHLFHVASAGGMFCAGASAALGLSVMAVAFAVVGGLALVHLSTPDPAPAPAPARVPAGAFFHHTLGGSRHGRVPVPSPLLSIGAGQYGDREFAEFVQAGRGVTTPRTRGRSTGRA